jgi:hypothetical protein
VNGLIEKDGSRYELAGGRSHQFVEQARYRGATRGIPEAGHQDQAHVTIGGRLLGALLRVAPTRRYGYTVLLKYFRDNCAWTSIFD